MRRLVFGLRLANRFNRSNIAVLKYHSVQERQDLFDDALCPSTIVPTSAFQTHMEMVAEAYDPVTMDDIVKFTRGEAKMPKKPVAVTFDDGYRDNFAIAGPILDKTGIRATIYVTAGSVGNEHPPWFVRVRHAVWSTKIQECAGLTNGILKIHDRDDRVAAARLLARRCAKLVGEELDQEVRRIEQMLEVDPFVPQERLMMDWEEIRRMAEAGHVIGSHTVSHPNVAHLSEDEMNRELKESKKMIEEEIGRTVDHFSYPNPALTPHMTETTTIAVRKARYQTAVVSTYGQMNLNCDRYSIKRTWSPPDKDQFVWNVEKALFGQDLMHYFSRKGRSKPVRGCGVPQAIEI